MKKVLTIAAAIGFVTIPSVAFANVGADATSPDTPPVAKVQHLKKKVHHGTVVSSVARTNSATSNDSDSAPTTTPAPTTTLTEAQARTFAQNTKANATVVNVELEHEHGTLVFEVKFSDGSKVYVDANTGAIVTEQQEHEGDANKHGDSDRSAARAPKTVDHDN